MDIARRFGKVAIKRLSSVETDRNVSHQHELNGVKDLLDLFGRPSGRERYPATFVYISDSEEIDSPYDVELSEGDGYVTWYDARAAHPSRTEYRLYYSSGIFQEFAAEGDLLVVCFDGTRVWMIAAGAGTNIENQLLWIFSGLSSRSLDSTRFTVSDVPQRPEVLTGVINMILESVGMEAEDIPETDIEGMIRHFGGKFPSTREFSEYARRDTGIATSVDDPDEILLRWWNREETLFRALEKHIVEERIASGFDSVDDFLGFSLSVHNRRKSRAGYAFENHLEQIFVDHGISYSRGQITERKSKPDFVFPSIETYRRAREHPELLACLTVLGAKTTCKDRWRQVTREAELVEHKHLVTLEPAISREQTDQMRSFSLQLVVPKEIVPSYSEQQQRWLMDISSFLEYVRMRISQGCGKGGA